MRLDDIILISRRAAPRRSHLAMKIDLKAVSLVEPSLLLRESYRELVQEFVENGEPLVPFPLRFPSDDFEALIKQLKNASLGIGIPEHFVPNTTYWLIDRRGEVLGVSNLRHRLTDSLRRVGGHIGYGIRPSARGQKLATETLRLTLLRAAEKQIKEVLLTCSKSNSASSATIVRNGGQLSSEEYIEELDEVVLRYWIRIG